MGTARRFSGAGTAPSRTTWDLPGRGQEIHLRGVSVFQLSGGLVVHEDVYWDTATLLAGAGLLSAG